MTQTFFVCKISENKGTVKINAPHLHNILEHSENALSRSGTCSKT